MPEPSSEPEKAGMPRWVKAFLLATALALVLLFAVIHMAGGGLGRHGA